MSRQPFSEALPKLPARFYWTVEWGFENESLQVSLHNLGRGKVTSGTARLRDGDGILAARARVLSVASQLLARAELEEQVDAEVIGEYPPVTAGGRERARRRAEAMKEER